MSRPYLSIDRLTRKLVAGDSEELKFLPGVNVFVGRPNTGKTQWLRTLDYLLGDPDENPFAGAEEAGLVDKYDSASVELVLGEERVWVERRWRELGAKTKIFVGDEDMTPMEFRHWLMAKLGMPVVNFPKGNPMSGQTWPELSFRTLLRHIYRQQRFWTGLADKQTDGEQHASLLQFLGLAERIFTPEFGKLIELKMKVEQLKSRRDQYGQTLDELAQGVLSEPDRTVGVSEATIEMAGRRIVERIASLRERRNGHLTQARDRTLPVPQRGRAEELGQKRARALAMLEELQRKQQSAAERSAELESYRSGLAKELDRITRAEEAGEVLADLKVTHCPACDQQVAETTLSSGECFLCHQALPDEPVIQELGAVRLRFESDRLNSEMREADDLIGVLKRDIKKLLSSIASAKEQLHRVEAELAPARQAVAALAQEEISAIDTFDALNRETNRSVPPNAAGHFQRTLSSTYDLASNSWDLTVSDSETGTSTTQILSNRYDTAERLISVDDSYLAGLFGCAAGTSRCFGSVVATYDPSGNLATQTLYGSGNTSYTETYTYDSLNRMLTLNGEGSAHANYQPYDLLGNPTSATWGDGSKSTWNYRENGDLTGLTHIVGTTTTTWGLTSSGAHQIVGEATSSSSVEMQASITGQTYAVNNLNQYTSVNGTTESYDKNGNLTGDGVWTYEYDEEGRLRQALGPHTVLYDYDPISRRRAKRVDGVWTYFSSDHAEEVADWSSSGVITARYLNGTGTDDHVAMLDYASPGCNPNPCKYYYHRDWHGSIVMLSNTSANPTTYRYGPYGEDPIDPTSGNPFRYTGRRLDPETGLYYYRARYYSAALGRFLQTDVVGQKDDVNLYAYTGEDPVNQADPNGTEANKDGQILPSQIELISPLSVPLNVVQYQPENTNYAVPASITVASTAASYPVSGNDSSVAKYSMEAPSGESQPPSLSFGVGPQVGFDWGETKFVRANVEFTPFSWENPIVPPLQSSYFQSKFAISGQMGQNLSLGIKVDVKGRSFDNWLHAWAHPKAEWYIKAWHFEVGNPLFDRNFSFDSRIGVVDLNITVPEGTVQKAQNFVESATKQAIH